MSFELSVPEKVIFGKGCLAGLEQLVAGYGDRALVVHGANPDRAQSVKGLVVKSGFETHLYSVGGEPTVEDIAKGVEEAKRKNVTVGIGIGGGMLSYAAQANCGR